jgi:putative heme-binding domain-containing protein
VVWDETDKIRAVLGKALNESDSGTSRWLLTELIRNKIDFEDTTTKALKIAGEDPSFRSTLVDQLRNRPALPAEAIAFLEGVASSDQSDPLVRSRALRVLQKHAGTTAARDALIHGLASIALLDRPNNDLLGVWKDFVSDGRNARALKTFVTMADAPDAGRRVLADAVLLQIETNARASAEAKSEARQAIDRAWGRPEAAVSLLRAIGLTRAEKYALQVRNLGKDADPDVRNAAAETARRLDLDRPTGSDPTIAKLPFDRVVADVAKGGDADLGGRLFERQGCVSCHTVSKSEGLKGPFLGDVSTRYSRKELAESILRPSAKISQGFETQRFATTSGQVIEGFVVRESGEEVELRNASGVVTVLPKSEIDERGKSETSVMPIGLVDQLTPSDLASILAYLESLKGK